MTDEKISRIADDIMKLSSSTLLVNMRFIDAALSRLSLVQYKGTFACNGESIFYDSVHVLRCFRQGREITVRSCFHMLLHCIFRHNITALYIDTEAWDLACDIAVETIINEMDLSSLKVNTDSQMQVISELSRNINYLTAEKIYYYLINSNISRDTIAEWQGYFLRDDHSVWRSYPSGDGSDGKCDNENSSESFGQLEGEWRDIAEKIQTDLETFSKKQGESSGSLVQNLAAVNREKYDYTAFLKKFSVMGEAMKINDDEFDYIFYTYGMNYFSSEGRKMPLIEPLEYKEVKKIKDFVIAIDTSGSVSGELVQTFIRKTYNILKQSENFFTRINIHIIQCDADIQEDRKITSQAEFDDYIKNMKLKGFGGTDFRPVFSHVNELIQNHEFCDLKGLIYFTDGYGTFPARKPDYTTAFIFIDDEYNNPVVPAWAVKLVLQKNEI